jgi:hypothetical protein
MSGGDSLTVDELVKVAFRTARDHGFWDVPRPIRMAGLPELAIPEKLALMTARRIAVYALLFIAALLILLFVIAPLPARAQYPSEQLFLPYVVHGGPYFTNLTLFNPTSDRVSVSFTFSRANTSDSDRSRPLADFHGDVYRLDPRESKTIEISEPRLGITGQGQLYIDACKEFMPCGGLVDPNSDPLSPRILQNFNPSAIRKISASVEIRVNVAAGTLGDSMLALPWYTLPGTDGAIGMDRVQLSDIRSDGYFSTQIGLNNASMYCTTLLTAILRDGAGVERGKRWAEHLGPLMSTKRSVEEMFGDDVFVANRLNRQPLASWYVEVLQTAVMPNGEAALTVGCESGCPRFYAWASVTDRKSGDFSLIQPVFENQSSEVAAAHTGLAMRSQSQARPARPATSEVVPLCTVEQLGPYEYLVHQFYDPPTKKTRPWMHIGPPRTADDPNGEMTMERIASEAEMARALCGAGRTGAEQ